MVITDVPFGGREAGGGVRFKALMRPGSSHSKGGDDDGETRSSQQYAAFLKEKERKCGPDGYLDSSRHKNTFGVKKSKGSDSKDDEAPLTVVDLAALKEKDEKEYDKRIKVIEDHMWQHKQEERELKRVEGDIIKNQRAVRRTLRDYENAVTRKRLAEDRKLNKGLEKYTDLQRAHKQNKIQLSKDRADKNALSLQESKYNGRTSMLSTSNLAREYRTKMSEIDLKRVEADRLSREYEDKIKRKEEEQFKLKQELAELSIALNMEAQKGRTQTVEHDKDRKKVGTDRIDDDRNADASLDQKMNKSGGEVKGADMTKRKLSADLALTRAHLSLKKKKVPTATLR